jgi:hypothetical protein
MIIMLARFVMFTYRFHSLIGPYSIVIPVACNACVMLCWRMPAQCHMMLTCCGRQVLQALLRIERDAAQAAVHDESTNIVMHQRFAFLNSAVG